MHPNFQTPNTSGTNPENPPHQNQSSSEQITQFTFADLVGLIEDPYTSSDIRERAWKLVDVFLWKDEGVPEVWHDWPELVVDGKLVTKESFIRDVLDHDTERLALSPESPVGDWKNWDEYTVDGKPVDKKTFVHEIDYHNMQTLDFHKRGDGDISDDAYYEQAANDQLRREYALSQINKICQNHRNQLKG